ncbi:Alpha/Beta hydrolase protein [Xylariaceae sp. FL1272]|nr:Alpha/Beta hydrolase protein [Xylariaceae sp. FL1272]
MAPTEGSDANAAHYLDDERFHQSVVLPPSASRPSGMKVTYADFGHRNNDRVVLFCPPLVGSRFVLSAKDKLARRHGVRIISPDRPGFGATPDAPPVDRVRVWVEIVAGILHHLEIPHVAVMGYSAGAIYAMNVLLHLRHMLHPVQPYVALVTPFVHTSHSDVTSLKLAGSLPDAVIDSYEQLFKAIGRMGPALQFSSGLSSLWPTLGGNSKPLAPDADPDEVAMEEKIGPEILRRITAENAQGVSQDILLLLKREDHPGCWGEWGDHEQVVPTLAEVERNRHATSSDTGQEPLRVRVFFAEADHMIGTTVALTWFNHCWDPKRRGDHIDYSSAVVPRTNHDNILDLRYGVVDSIFRDISN